MLQFLPLHTSPGISMSPSDSVAGSPPEIRLNPHRRHSRSLTASSISSSNSSSLSTFSSSTPSPCSSASAASASAVPFSWEHRPGIPKHPKTSHSAAATARPVLLLRPPPLRYRPNVRRRTGADPFAVALVECAKGVPESDDADGSGDEGSAVVARRSRVAAIAGWLSLLDLSGSCKAAGAVADAVVRIPRPRS